MNACEPRGATAVLVLLDALLEVVHDGVRLHHAVPAGKKRNGRRGDGLIWQHPIACRGSGAPPESGEQPPSKEAVVLSFAPGSSAPCLQGGDKGAIAAGAARRGKTAWRRRRVVLVESPWWWWLGRGEGTCVPEE